MKIKTCINYVLLCAAVASSTSLAGESTLVLRAKGPIIASPQGQTIDVLGTSYAVSADAKVIVDGSTFRYGKESAAQLTASSAPLVEIYSQGLGGPVKLVRTISGDRYVPGSTPIAIHGVVGWSNPSLGMLKIGKTLVNYSAALAANPQFAPQIGDEVVIDGIWTDPNSPVVAHHAVAAGTATTTNENAASINKAAPRPITTLGISGSGVISNGISGSGVISSGISGSGAKATTRPVTTLGISGSGVISNGISGSGVVSTGISGSGAKATLRPVTTLGISGSGVISNEISGSGMGPTR